MGKKKKGIDVKRTLIDETKEEYSPFSKVVLKPKKEEKKITPSSKKPGEIVKGYNPSLSFADILSSYEKTGDPYRMPKKSAASSSVSFGDILDEWESGGSREKKKTKTPSREENLSFYKATRSFASILNEYEGIYREEKKEKTKLDKEKARAEVSQFLRTSTMFLDKDEDVPSTVSWSVMGGRNENFVRKEETPKEDKKEYKRTTPGYTPSSSFSSILEEYEKGKVKKTAQTVEEKAPETKESPVVTEETSFFLKDDGTPVPDNVSWSIIGGKNENFIRKEEKKEEVKEEKKEYRRVSEEYSPTSSFSAILEEYEKGKIKKTPHVEEKTEEKKDIDLPEEKSFFLDDESVTVPDNVSWSIKGGRNANFVRKTESSAPLKKTKTSQKSAEYKPQSSFSEILTTYEEKVSPAEKTFSEIIHEKGDDRKKKTLYTINELRRMPVQATLDLHGETQKDSEALISSFLGESVDNGLRKVSIITGKGLHSDGGNSVLRDLTLSILLSSPLVQETSQAPLSKGGSGALWIILKEKSN